MAQVGVQEEHVPVFVPLGRAARTRVIAQSLQLHRDDCVALGKSIHFAGVAAAATKHRTSPGQHRSTIKAYRLANLAKHQGFGEDCNFSNFPGGADVRYCSELEASWEAQAVAHCAASPAAALRSGVIASSDPMTSMRDLVGAWAPFPDGHVQSFSRSGGFVAVGSAGAPVATGNP